MNILYVDDRYESTELIELLDKTNITYELCSECEARRNGYKRNVRDLIENLLRQLTHRQSALLKQSLLPAKSPHPV